MAVDELLELHERIDVWFGSVALSVYAPLIAITFALYLGMRRRLDGVSRILFTLATSVWVTSQLLEVAAHPPVGVGIATQALVIPEELGEIAGSALFAAALLAGVRAEAEMPGQGCSDFSGSPPPAGT